MILEQSRNNPGRPLKPRTFDTRPDSCENVECRRRFRRERAAFSLPLSRERLRARTRSAQKLWVGDCGATVEFSRINAPTLIAAYAYVVPSDTRPSVFLPLFVTAGRFSTPGYVSTERRTGYGSENRGILTRKDDPVLSRDHLSSRE